MNLHWTLTRDRTLTTQVRLSRKGLEQFFKVEDEFTLDTDKGQNTDYTGKMIKESSWEFFKVEEEFPLGTDKGQNTDYTGKMIKESSGGILQG
jgi:hypothetical protein